ncbi:TIGR04438 family Trp-rich protein [Paracidovorax wautersii]|jgi:small Trp-rich protein|uniref:TIGR04438 family Trp-rich protein n=1 Tax=Paracidovorax wautersii TaxID=1177982 RepID=UPI0031CFBF92
MYALGVGLLLVLLKSLEVGFVATWPWWWVLSPFAVAVVWWVWSDYCGRTARKAMQAMDQRKHKRMERQKEALGIRPRRPR